MSSHKLCINTPMGLKVPHSFLNYVADRHPEHMRVCFSSATETLFVEGTDYIKAQNPIDLICLGARSTVNKGTIKETDTVCPNSVRLTSYLLKLRDPTKQVEALLAVSVTNGRSSHMEESNGERRFSTTVSIPLKDHYQSTDGKYLRDIFECIKPEDGMLASTSVRISVSSTLELKTSLYQPHFSAEFYMETPLEVEVIGYTVAYKTNESIEQREAEYERNNRGYSQVVNFAFDPVRPQTVNLQEDCDNYFNQDLNKKEVKELIDWLQNVHDRMEDEDE